MSYSVTRFLFCFVLLAGFCLSERKAHAQEPNHTPTVVPFSTIKEEVQTAGMFFKNKTNKPMTVRCFVSDLSKSGFNKTVPAGKTVGANNFLTGQRVLAVWIGDKAHASLQSISGPNREYLYEVTMENGKVKVSPPAIRIPQPNRPTP